jgi:hypothetical protein
MLDYECLVGVDHEESGICGNSSAITIMVPWLQQGHLRYHIFSQGNNEKLGGITQGSFGEKSPSFC